MENPEEFVGSNDHQIIKARRNKRFRLLNSDPDATSSSSCGGGGEDFAAAAASSSVSGEVNNNNIIIDHHHHHHEIVSTEEEEDMANCLILLAQGDGGSHQHRRPKQILQEGVKIERISAKRFNFEMNKSGFYVYECKTCNRTFPSFQALGGHRASHKKPKSITAAATAIATVEELRPEEPQLINKIVSVATIAQAPTVKTTTNFQTQKGGIGGKIHECSICGLEFTSGQALGGHMRRHRATAVSSAQQVVATNTGHNHNHNHNHRNSSSSAMEGADQMMKQRSNILELDLNLPAPEEDLRETKFQFTATPQTIVFSAPTLVDCHY